MPSSASAEPRNTEGAPQTALLLKPIRQKGKYRGRQAFFGNRAVDVGDGLSYAQTVCFMLGDCGVKLLAFVHRLLQTFMDMRSLISPALQAALPA